jgi:hypothetical protein
LMDRHGFSVVPRVCCLACSGLNTKLTRLIHR